MPNAKPICSDDDVRRLIGPFLSQPGALLPILHAVQDAFGHVPDQAVPIIAKALNLSRAEVHGTVSFYHHFRQQPGGRSTIRICCAEACQAVGADDLVGQAQKTLGIGFHQTSRDGAVSLEPAYCLGQCATGPALLVDDEIHAGLNGEKLDRILRQVRGE